MNFPLKASISKNCQSRKSATNIPVNTRYYEADLNLMLKTIDAPCKD